MSLLLLLLYLPFPTCISVFNFAGPAVGNNITSYDWPRLSQPRRVFLPFQQKTQLEMFHLQAIPSQPFHQEYLSGCSISIQSAAPRVCGVLDFRCWWAGRSGGAGTPQGRAATKGSTTWDCGIISCQQPFHWVSESECQGLASCQGSKCGEASLMALFLRNKQLSVTHYHTQVLASLKHWKTASYKQGKWAIKQLKNDYTIMFCSGTISHKEDGIYPSFKSELLIQNYVCWESLLL